MVLCHLPSGFAGHVDAGNYLREVGLLAAAKGEVAAEAEAGGVMYFDELSDALAWAEDRLLEDHAPPRTSEAPLELLDMPMFQGRKPETLASLGSASRIGWSRRARSSSTTATQATRIFFVRSGSVRISLPIGKERLHVASFGREDFFGENLLLRRRLAHRRRRRGGADEPVRHLAREVRCGGGKASASGAGAVREHRAVDGAAAAAGGSRRSRRSRRRDAGGVTPDADEPVVGSCREGSGVDGSDGADEPSMAQRGHPRAVGAPQDVSPVVLARRCEAATGERADGIHLTVMGLVNLDWREGSARPIDGVDDDVAIGEARGQAAVVEKGERMHGPAPG